MDTYFHENFITLMLVFAVGALATGLVVLTRRWTWLQMSWSSDLFAIQTAHGENTPRLGGVSLAVTIIAATHILVDWPQSNVMGLLACALPLLLTGVLEDLHRNVRPIWRLVAAATASGLVILLLDFWLPRFDMPLIDDLMAFRWVAWLVSIFAVTGLVHAFNIIDGLNGLSLSVAIAGATALALIGYASGDRDIARALVVIIVALSSVLVWNFPAGKIFVGDAGAYLIGFLIGWIAIDLVVRNPRVSPWAVLLTCFWPIAETVLAIVRRLLNGNHVFQPDFRHTHQLVLLYLELRWFGPNRRKLANPSATAVMAPFFSAPPFVGVLVWDAPVTGFLAVAAFAIMFLATYRFLLESLCSAGALSQQISREPATLEVGRLQKHSQQIEL